MTWRNIVSGKPPEFVPQAITPERLEDLRAQAKWRAKSFRWAEEHLELIAHIDELTAEVVRLRADLGDRHGRATTFCATPGCFARTFSTHCDLHR